MTRHSKHALTAPRLDETPTSKRLLGPAATAPITHAFEVASMPANIYLPCTGSGVPAARPTLTVVVDSCTRTVVGCHVGFDFVNDEQALSKVVLAAPG